MKPTVPAALLEQAGALQNTNITTPGCSYNRGLMKADLPPRADYWMGTSEK